MIAPRAVGVQRAPALVVAVGVAVLLRSSLGGTSPAASAPAALAFAAFLGGAAVWGGARLARVKWGAVLLGVAGATALVVLSLAGVPAVHLGARASAGSLVWWVPLVTAVAATEELVLRGVLFDAVQARAGEAIAVAVTAVLFALIHLPLYGAPALGLDLCAGVFLGCLRVASGSVAAPLVAHVLADVATSWIG